MRLAVILAAVIFGFDRHRGFGDNQLTGRKYRFNVVLFVLFINICIERSNIVTSSIYNRVSCCKRAISVFARIGSLRRSVNNGQNIAFTKALDSVIINVNRFAGAFDRFNERTTFLF